MVDPLSYFSFQPVLHNIGHGGVMHIKELLLLIVVHTCMCLYVCVIITFITVLKS